MESNFEHFIENIIFYSNLDEAIISLKNLNSQVTIEVETVGNFIVPEGLAVCSDSGSGMTTPVKRLGWSWMEHKDDVLLGIGLHEFWTSHDSTPEKQYDMFFWDIEADEEVGVSYFDCIEEV